MAKVDSREKGKGGIEVSWTEGESEVGERKKEKGREERIKERSKPRREEEGGFVAGRIVKKKMVRGARTRTSCRRRTAAGAVRED